MEPKNDEEIILEILAAGGKVFDSLFIYESVAVIIKIQNHTSAKLLPFIFP